MMQTFGIGARGFLVKVYQDGLQRALGRRLESGGNDGRYGKYTAQGTIEFAQAAKVSDPDLYARLQSERALFGQAGPSMWRALDLAWPELFARCLQLTAGFEGTGFSGSCGPADTGDTAGVTFGLVGFTSYNGELQGLLRKAQQDTPLAFEQVGCAALGVMPYTYMLGLIRAADGSAGAGTKAHATDNRAFERWALKSGKVTLSVKTWLAALGELEWFRHLQMQEAYSRYWTLAAKQAAALFEQPTDRAFALMFDIAVQNGGLKRMELADLAQMFTNRETETDRMHAVHTALIARLRDAKRPAKIIEDVRSRKGCIVSGSGIVHGDSFIVRTFAL